MISQYFVLFCLEKQIRWIFRYTSHRVKYQSSWKHCNICHHPCFWCPGFARLVQEKNLCFATKKIVSPVLFKKHTDCQNKILVIYISSSHHTLRSSVKMNISAPETFASPAKSIRLACMSVVSEQQGKDTAHFIQWLHHFFLCELLWWEGASQNISAW